MNVFSAVEGCLAIAPLKRDRTGMKTSDLIFRNWETVLNELRRCHERRFITTSKESPDSETGW